MNDRAMDPERRKSPDSPAADALRARMQFSAVKLLADEVVVHIASRLRVDPVQDLTAMEVDIAAFTDALLSKDPTLAPALIAAERNDGVTRELVYLNTLAGSARLMGEMWEQDRISFLDMTVAMGRVFSIMRQLRHEDYPHQHPRTSSPHALFITVPGETHTLGVTMAADIFRQRGWQITLRTGLSHADLIESLRYERHPVIGISAGHPSMLEALTRLMVALRLVQPQARIIVGGQVVQQVEGLNAIIHADALLNSATDLEKVLSELSEQAGNSPAPQEPDS
jgi:methanogenic corrinoid protein MtbC1